MNELNLSEILSNYKISIKFYQTILHLFIFYVLLSYNFAPQKDDPSSIIKTNACLKAGGGKY
jgi:hypothetical protein